MIFFLPPKRTVCLISPKGHLMQTCWKKMWNFMSSWWRNARPEKDSLYSEFPTRLVGRDEMGPRASKPALGNQCGAPSSASVAWLGASSFAKCYLSGELWARETCSAPLKCWLHSELNLFKNKAKFVHSCVWHTLKVFSCVCVCKFLCVNKNMENLKK